LTAIHWVIIIAVCGWLAYGSAGTLSGLTTLAKTPPADSLSAVFSICAGDRHANCVVDGDTFWFQGEKIRIAESIRRNSAHRVARRKGSKARLRKRAFWHF